MTANANMIATRRTSTVTVRDEMDTETTSTMSVIDPNNLFGGAVRLH